MTDTPLDIITAAQALIAASTAVGTAQADLMAAQTLLNASSAAFVAIRGDDICAALPASLSGQEASDVIRAISLIVPITPGPIYYQPVIGGQS